MNFPELVKLWGSSTNRKLYIHHADEILCVTVFSCVSSVCDVGLLHTCWQQWFMLQFTAAADKVKTSSVFDLWRSACKTCCSGMELKGIITRQHFNIRCPVRRTHAVACAVPAGCVCGCGWAPADSLWRPWRMATANRLSSCWPPPDTASTGCSTSRTAPPPAGTHARTWHVGTAYHICSCRCLFTFWELNGLFSKSF